jgi:hypothetical protein
VHHQIPEMQRPLMVGLALAERKMQKAYSEADVTLRV